MSVQAGEAYIPVRADMSGFGAAVESGVEKGTKGSKLKGTAAKMGGALAAGAAASFASDFASAAIGGARESQAIANQTAQVIKSTGSAANVTAEGVDELSAALSRKTAIDDEVIQSGANLLLTFTSVKNELGEGNDVFDQTVALANDMSVAMGQDMKSSTIQLGKALNDPIKGVSALGKVGVQFTKDQKEQIKTLVESGDQLGAQKIILKELETQFGGSAEAQADSGKKMQVAWGNFQETIGGLLIPALDKLLAILIPIAEWAAEHPGVILAVAAVIGGALVAAFVAWAISAATAAAATIAAAAPVLAIIAVIGLLVIAALYVWSKWDEIWGWIKDKVSDAWNAISGFVSGGIDDVVGFFTGLPSRLASAAGDVFGFLWSSFKGALNRIVRAWNDFKIPSVKIGGWDIPGPGPNVPSFTTPEINFPNLPTFHTGGTYKAPPGQREGLALLLDGETVLPPGARGGALVGGDLVVQVMPEEDPVGRAAKELRRVQLLAM